MYNKAGVYAPPANDTELNEKIAVLSSLIQIQVNHSTLPLDWKKFALTDATNKLEEQMQSQYLKTGIPITKDEIEMAIDRPDDFDKEYGSKPTFTDRSKDQSLSDD